MKLSPYKFSVVYLTNLQLENMNLDFSWIMEKKDFYRIHIDTIYTPLPLLYAYDFSFLSFAEAARYASMFSCLDHTKIHLEFIHFNK